MSGATGRSSIPTRAPLAPALRLALGLALALTIGGCATLRPPADPATAAAQVTAALAVIEQPGASGEAVRRARDDYRKALNDVMPQVLAGEAGPAFVLATDPATAPADDADAASRATRPARFSGVTPVPPPGRVTLPGLHRDGLGAPAVGRIPPVDLNAPRLGYRVPVTALAEPGAPGAPVRVRLANPLRDERVRLGDFAVPVAMDLDAPIDATRAIGPGWGAGLRYLLRADRFAGQARIKFLWPFDPDKRPLVLIHGLGTTPRMWDPLVRQLLADPVVRTHYQIWFFFYPTAQPVPLSALQLRDELAAAARRHGLKQPVTLFGYSMGGVLARAQVSTLDAAAAEAVLPGVGTLPAESPVRRALEFAPSPYVSRVVFLFTPHRGSQFALVSLNDALMRLIRLPLWVRDEIATALESLAGAPRGALPTSIHGLAPHSPFLAALNARPPAVPHHSVIGVRGARGDLSRASDGVVPFTSAHLPSAASEITVPTGHGGFDHPDAVAELLRILRADVAAPPAR